MVTCGRPTCSSVCDLQDVTGAMNSSDSDGLLVGTHLHIFFQKIKKKLKKDRKKLSFNHAYFQVKHHVGRMKRSCSVDLIGDVSSAAFILPKVANFRHLTCNLQYLLTLFQISYTVCCYILNSIKLISKEIASIILLSSVVFCITNGNRRLRFTKIMVSLRITVNYIYVHVSDDVPGFCSTQYCLYPRCVCEDGYVRNANFDCVRSVICIQVT